MQLIKQSTVREEQIFSEACKIETAHPESTVEWWFFHGFFSGENLKEHSFMVSFFRHNIAEENEKPKSAYSLIFSTLCLESGKKRTVSKIDESLLNAFVELLERGLKHELDPDLIKVLHKELTDYGPPKPFVTGEVKTDFSDDYLSIGWEDFTLTQRGETFELKIPGVDDESRCQFILKPLTGLYDFEVPDGTAAADGKVPYRCYPMMNLTGFMDEKPVEGKAWMDHQWGTTGWFVSKSEKEKLLGWDWFGINLENGTNLIIMIHKYARTGAVLHNTVAVLRNNQEPELIKELEYEVLEYWESPDTHIRYPVEWSLRVPELNLSLQFSPHSKDQEIPVFGLARAIWEGSGDVSGSLNGNPITGTARGEFCGYGYIYDFQNFLSDLADRVDKRIEEFFPKRMDEKTVEGFVGKPHWINEPSAHTEMISKPVWDLILRSGKRWRPIFGILMQEALGKPSVNYERSWCLAELIHSGALIVDDIEDNSDLRRGEPALHIKYGLDVALNAGNLLYFLPTVELFLHEHLNDSQKLAIHEIMMDTCLKGHFGQTLDIYWSRNMSLENLSSWMDDDIEPKILQMYDYKTAAGPKGLARVASVLNNVEKDVEDAAVAFARAFAVGFQIVDDVHNFSGSPKWTKVQGEDISNGKMTYVIAKAIKMLDGEVRERLKEILCDKNLRTEEATLQEAVELVQQSGALDQCKREARRMSMEGWELFAKAVPGCEAKIMLNMLHLKMLDLAYDT